MVNKVLVLLVIAAVAGAALGGLRLLPPGDAYASGHSATRSFSATSVAPGETVTVTIVARDYGRLGGISETVPDAFTTSDGSQTVQIAIQEASPQTVTYTVTAKDRPGAYTFSGHVVDEDKNRIPISGASRVTIAAPPATTPTATRSFSRTSVEPGDDVTVTIVARDYGELGGIEERVPDGFTTSDGNQTVQIPLLAAPQTATYTVTATETTGTYTFSGNLRDEDRNPHNVGGASRVTITAPPATTPTATRSFSPASVRPGGQFTVRIRAANYGELGGIVETLPPGFTSEDAEGQMVEIPLLAAPQTVTYTVTAPDTTGTYTFSGVLRDEDRNPHNVGGAARVTVRVPAPPPPEPQPDPPNRSPRFDDDTTSRTVDENLARTNVGAAVTARDPDGDTLTYSLSGSSALFFTIDDSSGQLQTKAALDYERRNSYSVTVTATDDSGASNNSDYIDVTIEVTNVEEPGTVRLSPMNPVVGAVLTARLTDPDGGVTGMTWQWSRSMNMGGTFMDIDGATMMSYTPVTGDVGYYLMAKAMYADGHGSGKTAMAKTAGTVIAVRDRPGMVSLSPMNPVVGTALTATLTDPNVAVANSVTWQWSRSMTMDGTFMDIDGATMASYTPVTGDVGYYLRAKAMYTDGHGPDKTAMEETDGKVKVSDPLVARYDTNNNGMIERSELDMAIRDHIGDTLSRVDLDTLIRLYIGS